jgi:hypothetical protein
MSESNEARNARTRAGRSWCDEARLLHSIDEWLRKSELMPGPSLEPDPMPAAIERIMASRGLRGVLR